MTDIRLEHVWQDLHHFQDWYDGMKARPSFAEAFYPESHVALSESAKS